MSVTRSGGTGRAAAALAAAGAAWLLLAAGARAPAAWAQAMGQSPTGNPQSATWQHVRMDSSELRALGNGSVEAGLNALGAQGYELFLVTSNAETAAAGFHYLKRPPWNRPMPRPKVQYRVVDPVQFRDGLTEIEKENWELVAVTSTKNGGVLTHYFRRMAAP